MPKKDIVELSCVEQELLKKLTTTGRHAAYKINHGRILLMADINQSEDSWTDESISKALGISIPTIERVRRRFVEEGIDSALNYRQGRGRKQKRLDGTGEAHLLALVCKDTKWVL
jgi:hypothetical protein